NFNFEQFWYEALGSIDEPVVWGLDEVDRLFGLPFAADIFGLFRSWHNARALEPEGPWPRLTLVMAYATEAHLFITDLNQSPFNVGTQLLLSDFTAEQVADLNQRYGAPLRDGQEMATFFRLVGGNPYLVRRGLHELKQRRTALNGLHAEFVNDAGPFGDHLRRMLAALARDQALSQAIRGVLRGEPLLSNELFYRLKSAGILTGDSAREARMRCELYGAYLEKNLATIRDNG
ncbi:MAG TPA: AAA-like domain-containing protein, partial [Blastocatellia bacterium]